MIRHCAFCGMQFEAHRPDTYYCSEACYLGAQKRRREELGLRELRREKFERLKRYAVRVDMWALVRRYKPHHKKETNR